MEAVEQGGGLKQKMAEILTFVDKFVVVVLVIVALVGMGVAAAAAAGMTLTAV